MEQFQDNILSDEHPRVLLFFRMWIEKFVDSRIEDEEMIAFILDILWSDLLLPEEQQKIIEYKQESRVKKYISGLLEKYKIEEMAKNPDDFENIVFSLNAYPKKIAKNTLEKYYDDVYYWFCREYGKVFSNETIKNNILQSIEHFSFQTLEKDIMMQVLVEWKDLNEVQPFMRAYQGLTNHSYYEFNEKVFSSFTNNVTQSLLKYSWAKKEDIYGYIENIQIWYDHISDFFKWEEEQNKKFYTERCEIIDDLEKIDKKGKDELKKDFKKIFKNKYHQEYSSIIRHTYDRIFSTAPDILYKKDPVVMFAVVVLAVETLYGTCGKNIVPKSFHHIEHYTLRSYILSHKKNVNMSDVERYAYHALNDLLYMMADDISPLFFFPVMKTEKKEKELINAWEKLKQKVTQNYWL